MVTQGDAALEEALAGAHARASLPTPELRRALRQALGLSQEQVATAVGVTREAVTRWELGQRTPRGGLLLRYVAVLDRLAREAAARDTGGSSR